MALLPRFGCGKLCWVQLRWLYHDAVYAAHDLACLNFRLHSQILTVLSFWACPALNFERGWGCLLTDTISHMALAVKQVQGRGYKCASVLGRSELLGAPLLRCSENWEASCVCIVSAPWVLRSCPWTVGPFFFRLTPSVGGCYVLRCVHRNDSC